MKINVLAQLHDLTGEPLEELIKPSQSRPELCPMCAKKISGMLKPVTLKDVCLRALTFLDQKAVSIDPVEKFKMGDLARKIYNDHDEDGMIELTTTELKMVVDAVGDREGSGMVVIVWPLLGERPGGDDA